MQHNKMGNYVRLHAEVARKSANTCERCMRKGMNLGLVSTKCRRTLTEVSNYVKTASTFEECQPALLAL